MKTPETTKTVKTTTKSGKAGVAVRTDLRAGAMPPMPPSL